MDNINSIKKELFESCFEIIEKRIHEIENRLNSIHEARNNETKSSVGDKYETGRSMMQLEEENFNIRLVQAREIKKKLSVIDLSKTNQNIQHGSLIYTSTGIYFFSIGIGKVTLDGKPYYCISADSPIGKLLRNKKEGDKIVFNKAEISIEKIH